MYTNDEIDEHIMSTCMTLKNKTAVKTKSEKYNKIYFLEKVETWGGEERSGVWNLSRIAKCRV